MAQCLKPFLRYIVTTAVIFYIAEGQNILGQSQKILLVKFNFNIIRECQILHPLSLNGPSIGIQIFVHISRICSFFQSLIYPTS